MSDEPPETCDEPAPGSRRGGRDARPYHHGDLRRALVDAGRRLLEREGMAALSLRAVAREAGVSAAAPYHHFADRAALLYAVAHVGHEALYQAVLAAFESTEPGQARIVAVGMAYVGFALENPALYRLMFDTSRLYNHVPNPDEPEGKLPHVIAATFGASLPARRSDLDRHLAAIAGWAMFRGLAQVAQFRSMESFKALVGGERGLLEAVLSRIDFESKPKGP